MQNMIEQSAVDRKHRLARLWSNEQLAMIAPIFIGDVVNVSAWDDRDKQGGHYKDYFINAASYSCTNHSGYRGFQGGVNEYRLDLTGEVPAELVKKFDVVFNHTTLEHIFEVRKAFANLCAMSKDIVIVVVPFAQVQHESADYGDYWRFTPSCIRKLFEENGLKTIYEASSPHRHAAIYLLLVGSRHPHRWMGYLPPFTVSNTVGDWIGETTP